MSDDIESSRPYFTDKRKQSLYFPAEMLEEIKREALRQDRSLSWIVQRAWAVARERIRKFEGMERHTPQDESPIGNPPDA